MGRTSGRLSNANTRVWFGESAQPSPILLPVLVASLVQVRPTPRMETYSAWPWGWLPLAVPLVIWNAARLSAWILGDVPLHLRLVGAGVWGMFFVVVTTAALAWLGAFYGGALLGVWGVAALVLLRTPGPRWRWPVWSEGDDARTLLIPIAVGFVALVLAVLSAFLLPVWHWDSLAYHLPYVNFLLQDRGIGGVPLDVPYLSTYPHSAELMFAALRLLLPDDRLIDLGQIPFGVLGGFGVASVACSAGARRGDALVAGALWCTLPAVFLQLPTNYVDVMAAAALLLASAAMLAPPRVGTVATAAVACGLYLGTKPSAPLGTAVLCSVLMLGLLRAGRWRLALGALALVIAVGGESYLRNVVRYGNPIWPVIVDLGPIHLPGIETLEKLLSSGAGTYRLSGPLPLRVLRSWTSLTAPPMFDMRVGGFGPLFLVSIPFAIAVFRRRGSWVLGGLLLASVAAADPSLARYILAFPGLLLGLAASAPFVREACPRRTVWIRVGVGLLGVWNLVYAAPALAGEGPPLWRYAAMDWEARRGAVGGEGPPTALLAARDRMRDGDGAAFDRSMDFPYLLWTPDLRHRVIRVPDHATVAEVDALMRSENVRFLGAGPGTPLWDWLIRNGSAFTRIHSCLSADCELHWRP